MLIAQAESAFRAYLERHGKLPEHLLPEELLSLGFAFYEEERAIDALPVDDESFGDALLFQWGTREALPSYYGACYYFDLTRQFISHEGEDDDAMFQLTCQLQYELTPELRQAKQATVGAEALLRYQSSKPLPLRTLRSRVLPAGRLAPLSST